MRGSSQTIQHEQVHTSLSAHDAQRRIEGTGEPSLGAAVIFGDTIDAYVIDGKELIYRKHSTGQIVPPTLMSLPCIPGGMRPASLSGTVHRLYRVAGDSNDYLVHSIHFIVKIDDTWVDCGLQPDW